MDDLEVFLASVPAFAVLDAEDRAAVAARCHERTLPAGARLLAQGARNQILFVLRSGQVAVRTHQGDRRETIARVNPPAVLGEISFLTGRACSADVDVVVDARVVELPLDALASLPIAHERLVRGLASVLADRLYTVVATDRAVASTPVVLVCAGPAWVAPRAFAVEMARALARESDGDALLVRVGGSTSSSPTVVEPGVARASIADHQGVGVRAEVAALLPAWTTRFSAVVMSVDASAGSAPLDALSPLATHSCFLLGPGDAIPAAAGRPVVRAPSNGVSPVERNVIVAQDAREPTLPVLDGRHRLIRDAAEAEAASVAGRPAGDSFRAGVASLARAVFDRQVGIVLGAGGARGWCHAGVLDALNRGGLPIDLIAGTSMGAVVGGLWAGGASSAELAEAAVVWRRRGHRLREWRVWRMHMASERQLDNLFFQYFGDRAVNATVTPFWANAADIERGDEVLLREGLLRQVVRASMAFPGWTPPVCLNGRLLVDGAVVNSAPAQAARDMGAAFVVTVLAMGSYEEQRLAPRYPRRAYDLFARAFQLSGVAMALARSERASDIVLVPDLGDATMLSFERDRELIEAGRRAAEVQLPAILEAYARLKEARHTSPGPPVS